MTKPAAVAIELPRRWVAPVGQLDPDLRFDEDGDYYIANFRPTDIAVHNAEVSICGTPIGSRQSFEVWEPGKAGGKGKSQ